MLLTISNNDIFLSIYVQLRNIILNNNNTLIYM